MKNSSIKTYLIGFIVIIPLLFTISFTQKKINFIKEDKKLVDTNVIKNAPPVIAFTTIALGCFRGVLTDILWLKMNSLQENGQYFEMVQLASWITKLQPRFTQATAFLAWNMAYNISVTCSSFEDRWRWVQKGIELIRDEGLVYNPGDPVLYKELGWIYQHKIGNMMDDAHQFYKNRMAIELMKVLGKGEIDWDALAKATKSEQEISKELKLNKKFWNKLIANSATSQYKSLSDIENVFREKGELPENLKQALIKNNKNVKLLVDYLRSKWLKDKFKLDPIIINKLNKKYGKLDWRLPEAQALYWATLGIKNDVAGTKVNQFCDRMVSQSLRDAFMGGRLVFADPNNENTFLTIPNLELADSVYQVYQKIYKRQKNRSFRDGMINFLKDVVVMMYTFGKKSKAEKFLKILRKESPHNKEFQLSVDQYVLKEWKDDAKSATVKQIQSIVGSMIYQSYYLAACGEEDAANSHMQLARGVFNIYKKQHLSTWKRVGFSFELMNKQMKKMCLNTLASLKKYKEEHSTKMKNNFN